MRSPITTSAPSTASSREEQSFAPSRSMPLGISVSGAYMRTSAPNFVRPNRLDLATRECLMSPRIATFSPSIFPNLSRMVHMSRRACVGCSFMPSPALRTLAFTVLASR